MARIDYRKVKQCECGEFMFDGKCPLCTLRKENKELKRKLKDTLVDEQIAKDNFAKAKVMIEKLKMDIEWYKSALKLFGKSWREADQVKP